MVVAGMVLGILGVTVFWWLGVVLGGLWTTGESVSLLASGGGVSIDAGPVCILGLSLGVGLPVVGVVLSISGMLKGQAKGIGIVGIVTGAVAAVLGLVATLLPVFFLNVAESARNQDQPDAVGDQQMMQQKLDDPAFQAQILKAMQAAGDNAVKEDPSENTAEAVQPK